MSIGERVTIADGIELNGHHTNVVVNKKTGDTQLCVFGMFDGDDVNVDIRRLLIWLAYNEPQVIKNLLPIKKVFLTGEGSLEND